MSIETIKLYKEKALNRTVWGTALNASDTSAKDEKGAVRWSYDPVFGIRGFQYVRFDQSGGADKGQLVKYSPLTTITNITSGTTTTITTSGLTANILVDGILRCSDDAGGAGAAPEGEQALITANTATLITIDSNDAFSVSPAVNDDFTVELPWSVADTAAGDTAVLVAGVVLTDQDQYDWGWVQFAGLCPEVNCIAAGTAITAAKSLIADTNVVTNGSTSAVELRVGYTKTGISSDTVLRKIPVYLNCGVGLRLGASA